MSGDRELTGEEAREIAEEAKARGWVREYEAVRAGLATDGGPRTEDGGPKAEAGGPTKSQIADSKSHAEPVAEWDWPGKGRVFPPLMVLAAKRWLRNPRTGPREVQS